MNERRPREMPIAPRREQYRHGRARAIQVKVYLRAEHVALLDALAQRGNVTRTVVIERLLEQAADEVTHERGNAGTDQSAGGNTRTGG